MLRTNGRTAHGAGNSLSKREGQPSLTSTGSS